MRDNLSTHQNSIQVFNFSITATQLNSTVQLALFPEMQQPKVLQGKIDAYNGVIVDHNSIPSGETEFAVVLQSFSLFNDRHYNTSFSLILHFW